jgi:hypothetical protein
MNNKGIIHKLAVYSVKFIFSCLHFSKITNYVDIKIFTDLCSNDRREPFLNQNIFDSLQFGETLFC